MMDEISGYVHNGVKSVMPYLEQMIMMRIKISQMKSKDYSDRVIKELEEGYYHYKLLFLDKLEGYDPFNTP